MVLTRKRILIFTCVVALSIYFLRLLFESSLPILTNQFSSQENVIGLPVLVTVFYEALCPDSKYFISKQLLPTFKVATSIMEVKLVPYGKATTILTDGNISFECQHGPTECQANIYHACAIDIIESPMVLLEVISCMIQDNRLPQAAMQRCAKKHNVDNIEHIEKCFASSQGSKLLKLNGDATRSLRPEVTFIPTITLDGFQGRQASILKNLLFEVCKAFGDIEKSKNICLKFE